MKAILLIALTLIPSLLFGQDDLQELRQKLLDAEMRIRRLEMIAARPPAPVKDTGAGQNFAILEPRREHERSRGSDIKVAVSASSTGADFIGVAKTDGVLRTDSSIDYADGTDYITLGVSPSWFSNQYDATLDCVAVSNCIGTPWDVYATNHTDLLFTGSGAIGTGESGGNTDHDDAYWHSYNDGTGGAHANYIDGKDYRTTGDVHADTVHANTVKVGAMPEDFTTIETNSIASDVTGTVQFISDGNMNMYTESTGDAFFGAVGSGDVFISANTGDTYVGGANLLFSATTAVKIDTVTCDTEGTLFTKGFFVNTDSWTVQTISYIEPGGTTNTMTVLAKP